MDQTTGSTAVSARDLEQPKTKAKNKKAKVAKGKAKPVKKEKPKGIAQFREGTIGRQIAELIVAGKQTNDEILESVKKAHKGCSTTSACVAWYRSTLRKRGITK